MVSIKRVLAVTAGLILTGVVVGAACGGALGLLLTANPIVVALAGFSAAAIRLAFVTRRSPRRLESGDASGGNTSLGSI